MGGRGRGSSEDYIPSMSSRGGGSSGPPRGASGFPPRGGPLQAGEVGSLGGPNATAAQSRLGESGAGSQRPPPAPEFNMMTNDFPALPGSRETGPAKGEEPRGFLEVVKGTAKLRLEDPEASTGSEAGPPDAEDHHHVVTVEPGGGDRRMAAATPDFPEEISSHSKPPGHR